MGVEVEVARGPHESPCRPTSCSFAPCEKQSLVERFPATGISLHSLLRIPLAPRTRVPPKVDERQVLDIVFGPRANGRWGASSRALVSGCGGTSREERASPPRFTVHVCVRLCIVERGGHQVSLARPPKTTNHVHVLWQLACFYQLERQERHSRPLQQQAPGRAGLPRANYFREEVRTCRQL